MAVVDDRGQTDYPAEPPGEDFGRQPPHDMAAEQSVLGGMLLSKDAIADVIEVLRPGDFYRPAHQAVYDAILDLYGRGEPADPVTVAAGLDRRGELNRIGGAPYLVTLTQTVPTAANAGYYAEIVAEKSILRRLVEAGTRIVQYGYAGADGQDVAEVVDRAQAEVYEVTERRSSEDFLPLEELLQPTMDEIDSIASRGGISLGVPTGFTELDEVTNGLHPGQMIIVAARPGVGKALALDTPLPTPSGWTTMGQVRVGDELIDADGRPTRVVAATDVLHDRPCYEVEFSDGTVLVADAQHQWLTDTRASRRSAKARSNPVVAQVRTTAEIAATLRCETADRRLNHSVTNASPLDLPSRDLSVPPYTLGAWLGDGISGAAQLTTADPEIVVRIEGEGLTVVPSQHARMRYAVQLPHEDPIAPRECVGCGAEFVPFTGEVRTCGRSCGGKARFCSQPVAPPKCPLCGAKSSGLRMCQACRNDIGSVQGRLRTIGVLGDKHIPVEYLRSSEAQRRALLAGLLDTDGTVTMDGSVQFSVTSERLVRDVAELVVSLGYRCHLSTKRVRGRTELSSTAYTVTFATDDEVFGLHRKSLLHKQRRAGSSMVRSGSRFITDVRKVESVPMRCVEVDNPNHLYLAGHAMVPTHNSTLGMDFMRSCSIRNGLPSVIFSLEMSRTEIVMRLLSAEAKIKLGDMRSGRMSDDDWTKLARRMSEISEAPLFVDDSPNLTMMEIRAKARRLKQRHDLKLVVVDYLQLMTSGKKVESRQQEVSDFSRNLKLLAKELEVPVVAISQLNRGPEQRTDKRPMVSDLRESGCLPASTRILRADTGGEVTLGELIASGEQPLVWSLDERMRMVARPMVKAFPSGRKEVFRLRLASGREVEATGNHPFLTVDGWIPLDRLAVDDRLATPRVVPEPVQTSRMPEAEIILLAHMFGLRSHEKFIPQRIFALPNDQVALFVRHLWAADGSVRWDANYQQARINYASTSRRLIDDLAQLLLRLGVHARIKRVTTGEYRDCWQIGVDDAESQTIFLRDIGARGEAGKAAMVELAPTVRNTSVDTVPKEVRTRVRTLLATKEMTHREFSAAMGSRFCGSTMWKHSPSRSRLARVANVLEDADIDMFATNDVFWDRIVEITSLGEQDVYDGTVPGTNNFVAQGISVHNSLEQDADMVILLHRPDAIERDDPRGGEADLILGKHRNGPTATITVAHQLHLSRFVDMARG